VFVQHDRAVHLAGKAHAGDCIRRNIPLGQRFADGNTTRPPPVLGTLLRPADFRRGKWNVLFGGGSNNFPLLIDNQGARTASTDVNSK
jgi:hypothetical protein